MRKGITSLILSILCVASVTISSCSGLNGEYMKFNEGWLGTSNSLITYEFDVFGGVELKMSFTGSRTKSRYTSYKGTYKVEGNRLILNFGGSDRVFTLSNDKKQISDPEGNIYKKS